MASKLQIALGGIWLNVFGLEELLASSASAADRTALCLFFLHGRFGSAERVEHLVEKVFEDVHQMADTVGSEDGARSSGEQPRGRKLLVVTFDQRNHGTRKISATGQQSWSEGNPKHAQDMLAMQVGTANDVSFIADFLPSFLFPNGEASIAAWAVTGISLGGHSTWIVLKNDPRFRIGVPMLGCPSYRVLMRQRAQANGLPYAPPYMPESLSTLLESMDPDSSDSTSSDSSGNPFLGKKILVLHGDKDELVPWEASKSFVDGLQVGPGGEKRVCIEPGRGHETSAYMMEELAKFLIKHGLDH